MIKKDDIIEILPEFQDPGDSKFIWTAKDDEEKGRVTISPRIWTDRINPTQVVSVNMIKKAS